MAKIARRLMTGLALVGVAYALDPKRDLLRLDRWKEQVGPTLNRLQQQYGPMLRRVALAAGFVPGMRLRWRLLAAALPQLASALERAATGRDDAQPSRPATTV